MEKAAPQSATDASSGDATAAAGQVQSTTKNAQLSVGTAGGGKGALTVDNQHASKIVDSSAATSRSGISVALAPTPAAANAPLTGVTTASSGKSSATGVTANNDVGHTALAAVSVNGPSQAPLSVSSKSGVVIQDQGASAAQSGAAWAIASGATGSPSGVAAPAVQGAAPTSRAVSATGLQSQNDLSSDRRAHVTTTGGASNTAPITIAPSQVASVDARAMAIAGSGPTCAGGGCSGGNATNGGATQATSGVADAQGLVAQNVVRTTGAASVHVGGQNFAPIQVIIDSITQIFNIGVASSSSGDATAGGARTSGAALHGQTASSGSAQATGARIQNTINLKSSAAVRVQGNNYNPINLVLNLAANLFNVGVGVAGTGDTQASGGGSGTPGAAARSGAATATGLQVMNLVTMWAVASVDIEGDNYAPIAVQIHFKTNIDNRGLAVASSGNAVAGPPAETQPAITQPAASGAAMTSGAASQGSGGTSSRARSGNALAVANSVDASITSNQLSSANAAGTLAASAIPGMLRTLPTGKWSPFVEQNLPTTVAPLVQGGLNSTSGNSTAVGLHSTIDQTNAQLVACSDPNLDCVARNAATMGVLVRDSDTNPATRNGNGNGNKPGPNGTNAESGAALVNATPTPLPTPNGNANPNSSRWQRSGMSGVSTTTRGTGFSSGSARHDLAAQLTATGHVVLVDLWGRWPGRRLPPMPDLRSHDPTMTNVTVTMDMWPGSEELSLPTQPKHAVPETVAQARRAASSHDAIAGDDARGTELLAVTSVDPWDLWPRLDQLPVPSQVLPSASTTGEAERPVVGEPPVPDDAGVTPGALNLAALIGAALAVLGGTRRGRSLVLGLGVGILQQLRRLYWPGRLGWRSLSEQAARGLALVRLMLGILRLW
jgi:hypothetical protein